MVAFGEMQLGTFVSYASFTYFVVWDSMDRRFIAFAWFRIVGMIIVFGDESTLTTLVTLVSSISVTFSLLCSECLN